MKRALITGATGFVGPYMARELLDNGYEVFALVRNRSDLSNLQGVDIKYVTGDITDPCGTASAVKEVRPTHVFHLAAQSYVPESWRDPHMTYMVNINGTLNLLTAVRDYCNHAVVQICGSSEEYGLVQPEECSITEDQPLRPLSPYGVSKVAQDTMGYQWAHSYGTRIVRTRAFNHTGVGRGLQFVTATIARQAAEIKLGKREAFELGTLSAIRDFTDVRDIVRGYRLLVEALDENRIENGDVYNLSSGGGMAIGGVVDMFADIACVPAVIVQESDRFRPSDVPLLIGCSAKAKTAIGWLAEISLGHTFKEMLDWQLREVANG